MFRKERVCWCVNVKVVRLIRMVLIIIKVRDGFQVLVKLRKLRIFFGLVILEMRRFSLKISFVSSEIRWYFMGL